MLTYLEVQLHPERLSPNNTKGATLFAALTQSHELRADAAPGMRIALGWMFSRRTETYSHNGATGGFSSYAFFNRKSDYAAIILVNVSPGNRNTSFADVLGEHIAARLEGRTAISLQNIRRDTCRTPRHATTDQPEVHSREGSSATVEG